jgi:hypothetical protein
MKHCTASARVRLLALPLVQPHPPARLHQRRLHRRVRSLQAVPQGGVLRVGDPMGGVCLQGRELSDKPREVAENVPGNILRVLRAHLRHATRPS